MRAPILRLTLPLASIALAGVPVHAQPDLSELKPDLTLDEIQEFVAPEPVDETRVLVFSKTAGFRHGSIEAGVTCFERLGNEHDFETEHSEDSGIFNDEDLARFDAVVFLNTTQDVLDPAQEGAMKRFVHAGGGYLGVHAATDTEYDWPWYGQLAGAYFSGHPHIQQATIRVADRDHPATAHLPEAWVRTDEWYNFHEGVAESIRVLAWLDETTYEGGTMGDRHPVIWCHEFEGGRALSTAGGHTDESYSEPAFVEHLLGAVRWVTGTDGED